MAWIEPVIMSGAHVVLEPADDRHVPDLLAAAQDDLVWAWLPWPRPEREADVAAMLADERAVALPFAQVDAASGRRRRDYVPRRRRASPHARGRRHLDRAPVVADR